MSRVFSLISKERTQLEEYGKIKNASFDKKIAKIQQEKDKFNKELNEEIKKVNR